MANMNFNTKFIPLTVDPDKIYDHSFAIIKEEMGEHSFTDEEWLVVRRVIHASADFELGRSMIFTPDAIRGRNSIDFSGPSCSGRCTND